MRYILEWDKGSYHYEGGENVLHDITVKIAEKEQIAVIGSNGAGKSTFFLGCIGIIRPQMGEIRLMGEKLLGSKKELLALRKEVGLVFQDPDTQMIAPTVESEISFGPLNMGLPKEEVRLAVDNTLQEWGLWELRLRPPHFLSGGEKKRVSLGDVLVMKPSLLLLDEPTASLDGKNAELLKKKLQTLHEQGISLMVSTHDCDFIWEWAKRVIVFANGRIIADDTPERVFQNDRVIEEACILRPRLMQAAKEICKIKNLPKPWKLPRTQKEFALWLENVLS